MKLSPPGGDMNFWTIIWIVLGVIGVYFGVTDASHQTVLFGLVQIVGGVGIWLGFPSTKWLLIAFFCIGVAGRAFALAFGHFHPTSLTSALFFIFLAIRFYRWRPPNLPPSLPIV